MDPVVGGTTRSFSDQTIRQVVRLSTGGRTLRIRLTNEYGAAPVTIGAVHVALASGNGGIVAGSDRVVTFGVNWYVNRWAKLQFNVIKEELSDPSQGPLPGQPSFWSQVFRFQIGL